MLKPMNGGGDGSKTASAGRLFTGAALRCEESSRPALLVSLRAWKAPLSAARRVEYRPADG